MNNDLRDFVTRELKHQNPLYPVQMLHPFAHDITKRMQRDLGIPDHAIVRVSKQSLSPNFHSTVPRNTTQTFDLEEYPQNTPHYETENGEMGKWGGEIQTAYGNVRIYLKAGYIPINNIVFGVESPYQSPTKVMKSNVKETVTWREKSFTGWLGKLEDFGKTQRRAAGSKE